MPDKTPKRKHETWICHCSCPARVMQKILKKFDTISLLIDEVFQKFRALYFHFLRRIWSLFYPERNAFKTKVKYFDYKLWKNTCERIDLKGILDIFELAPSVYPSLNDIPNMHIGASIIEYLFTASSLNFLFLTTP